MYFKFFHVFVFILLGVRSFAQCDLSIIDVNLNTYEVTVAVGEGEGCTVNMLQIGFHIPGNEQPLSLGDCVMNPNNFHPGWWYSSLAVAPSSWADLPIANGDTIIIPLDNPFNADCSPGVTGNGSLGCCAAPFLDYYISEGLCIEFALWQVNFGATWYTADGGWAIGTNDGVSPYGPDSYPDQDCDNSWYTCRENNPSGAVGSSLCLDTLCIPQYITDTLYVSLMDTIYIDIVDTLYVSITDTLIEYVDVEVIVIDTVEIFSTDTLIVYEYIYVSDTIIQHDTTYVYDYVYVYDTIVEYSVDTLSVTYIETVYTTILLDCDTEEPCDYEILTPGCEVYVPNSVTPNNDGYNDGWKVVTDPECWLTWNLYVYNRWGEQMWASALPTDFWEVGRYEYYVPNGVYTWTLSAGTYEHVFIEKTGHLVVIR